MADKSLKDQVEDNTRRIIDLEAILLEMKTTLSDFNPGPSGTESPQVEDFNPGPSGTESP